MAGADSPQALRVAPRSRVISRQTFYPYPAEDPPSPTTYVLESKRARFLKIPLRPEPRVARRYFWAPGR